MMADEPVPEFIDPTVVFASGEAFELLEPLTNFRSCHDGIPFEARIVFTCRRLSGQAPAEELIMKVKVQLPRGSQEPVPGPSDTTAHELKALAVFRDAGLTCVPKLIGFHQQPQDPRGPFPGGYMTFTVMTKLPGYALFGKFWNFTPEQRDEIVPRAVKALHSVYLLGIEPVDRGLRNVIWEPESKTCGIIDFELWNETKQTFGDEKAEMQRWGLIRTPPAKDHWAAWNSMYR